MLDWRFAFAKAHGILAVREMGEPVGPTSPAADPKGTWVGLDPLVVQAAKEVDGTLLDWALSLTPRERLRASTQAERTLRKFVHAAPEDR
jgi:hypothetical protein